MGKDSTVITDYKVKRHDSKSGDASACLVIINGIEGVDLGKKFIVAQGSNKIGRSAQATIQVDEHAVSRFHAELVEEDGVYTLRDQDSTNGTYVNDRQVTSIELRDGDQIQIGRTLFKFLSGSNVEALYHEEVYRLRTIDGLTQAFNRNHFERELERELSRAIRYKRDLSLIMIDLDYFRQVNSDYGHLAGDFVLRQLSLRIREAIRRDDIFARYGGEEFALILPEVDRKSAAKLAEKLRLMIEKAPFVYDSEKIPLTLSLGIADVLEYRQRVEDPFAVIPQVLIKIADKRLYRAKDGGRNRVVWD